MLDASKAVTQRRLLTAELAKMRIRLNRPPPDITITKRKTGGVRFNATNAKTEIDLETTKAVLQTYKIFNADVLVRSDASVEDLIDTIEGNTRYIPCLYMYNKADTVSMAAVEAFSEGFPTHVCAATSEGMGLELVQECMWAKLNLCRLYTRKPGQEPDFGDAIIMRRGATVKDVCLQIHKDIVDRFKFATVWGRSVKHAAQRVGLSHVLEDEDVIQLTLER
eukprot:gnl/Ergobibamus_cyprinoides/173.p2 GENE.gnl/Ergobibamus_cyprinoides/173~~gnl/Ergobibamus_cyprinoides/173.p2  ORF type:complete len:222 (+),score=54.76 gnl/Ergobibamus_cyprinoides/173:204-869(+)